MKISTFYQKFSSDCTAGSANQVLTQFESEVTVTGRCFYRLSHGGENYALLFSNQIDSTYADGSISRANDIGRTWKILSMRTGLCMADGEEPKEWHRMTFDGSEEKTVSGPEVFCTDAVKLSAHAGDVLCYEITLCGACYPYHEEIVLPVSTLQNGVFVPDRKIPVPLMIGSDRPVRRRIGFIGDSVTQGCGTAVGSYTHWAARIAEKLPEEDSVWNLGIGYARGYDAATDGAWLARAKTCDIVNVCFGVNDLFHDRNAEEIAGDLSVVITALHQAGCKVILFTVPPFNMEGKEKENWYRLNQNIRTELRFSADGFFDFAEVLGQPAPKEHCSVYGGHPNAVGCQLAADAYLAQKILSDL